MNPMLLVFAENEVQRLRQTNVALSMSLERSKTDLSETARLLNQKREEVKQLDRDYTL